MPGVTKSLFLFCKTYLFILPSGALSFDFAQLGTEQKHLFFYGYSPGFESI
jgi:hypothetical protein